MSRSNAVFRLPAPLLAALALLPLWARAGSWPEAPARFELENGLAVICFADGNSSNSVVQILVNGGQRLDAPGQPGLACLALNLSLQVPEPQDVRRLMEMGAVHALAVFPDYALITIQCQSVFLEETLKLLTRQMAAPLLTGLRIDAAKARLKNLLKQERERPLEAMRLAQRQAFFAGSAAAGSVFGNDASLAAFGKKEISALQRSLFAAKNIVLLVASDMNAAALREMLAGSFGRFPAGPMQVAPPAAPAPGPFPTGRVTLQTSQVLVTAAFLLPAASRESMIPAALLEALLGKGVASRLWALRSRHDLAYAFDAEYTALKQGSLLSIALKTSPARLEEARAFLDALFADLRENGVSATEFAAAQAVAGTEFLKNCESKNQISTFAAHLEGLGLGAGFMDEFVSRLQCLTLAEFNLYLKQVLQSQNRFDSTAGPES